jgi:hypothetical protein
MINMGGISKGIYAYKTLWGDFLAFITSSGKFKKKVS